MSGNILKSALGHYEPLGDPQEADCIIGHSFGTSIDLGSPNRALAKFIGGVADGRPVIADTNLVSAMSAEHTEVAHEVGGPVSNAVGAGVGSWGTLVEAGRYMGENGLRRPLMVAEAHHIGRVIMQAEKLHLDSIVPEGLPAVFDADSEQLWTRRLAFWVPREVLGSAVLKLQHKL